MKIYNSYYIKSLIAKNKIAEAAGHYEKVKDLLKEQLNVSPGKKVNGTI